MKAYGKVLDPTPLATLLIDQTTARASLDASSKEYERLKQLFAAGQNASARAVEAAEAMMKKDRIQLDAIQSRLALALGPEAASKFELPKMVDSLLQLKAALVRMDVPLQKNLLDDLTGHGLLRPLRRPNWRMRFILDRPRVPTRNCRDKVFSSWSRRIHRRPALS